MPGAGHDMDDEARAMHARRPFLEIRAELLRHNPSIMYFSNISIVQQARLVQLYSKFDEDFDFKQDV